jgi:hypothetical protein
MNTKEIATSCLIVGEVFTLPKDHVLKDENGNIINATKIVLEKKKKEYPKSYKESLEMLDYKTAEEVVEKAMLLSHFERLLVCRDAYWKLAGDWKPDWLDDDTKKYIITSSKVFETFGGLGYINYILTFPTEEMRDAFYENFKDLIEQCKELL